MMKPLDEQFRDLCGQHGWKRTAQRRAVFSYLNGNKEHPTVETVCSAVRETLPYVSLDSVYRILREFADAGLIRRLEGGQAVRFDPDTREHDHFYCDVCGRVFDFRCLDGKKARAACADLGEAQTVELFARGICHGCKAGV